MTRRIAAVLFLFSSGLFASYQYYLSTNLDSNAGYQYWNSNGQGQLTYHYAANSATGGSLISNIPVPTPSVGYEVKAYIDLAQSGGTYTIYLSATNDALSGPNPQGSYYAVELQNPVVTPTTCSANMVVYKRVNSVITMLWSSVISCRGRAEAARPILRAVHRTTWGGIYVIDEWDTPLVWFGDSDLTTGRPGVGARETPPDGSYPGNGIARVELGPGDGIAPYAVDRYQVTHTYTGGCLYLDWAAVADNPDGTGVRSYHVFRNGQEFGWAYTSNLTDCAVSAGQTYTYGIAGVDFHTNTATFTDVAVTAGPGPPPNPPHYVPPDPVRVGVRSTGAYWGAAPEQMDTRSGNLNFTVPLLRAMGRGGWGVTFALSYNSQLWFKEGAGQTKLGADVGYGFGWKLLAGALTPIWDSYTLVYYLFTDSSGAEYRLDVNENGVWRSSQGAYVYYDSNTGRLNFPDGLRDEAFGGKSPKTNAGSCDGARRGHRSWARAGRTRRRWRPAGVGGEVLDQGGEPFGGAEVDLRNVTRLPLTRACSTT